MCLFEIPPSVLERTYDVLKRGHDLIDLGLDQVIMKRQRDGTLRHTLGDGKVALARAEARAYVRLQVSRREVPANGDAARLHGHYHAVALHAFGERNDVDEPAHSHVRLHRLTPHPIKPAQPLRVAAGYPLALFEKLFDAP